MFVNYFANSVRDTYYNIFVARVVLGCYAIWKILSYDLDRLKEWPTFVFEMHRHNWLMIDTGLIDYIPFIKWACVIGLVLFTVGYRIGLSSFLSAFLIAWLSSMHYVVTNSGATCLPVVYLLLLFGLYRDSAQYGSFDLIRNARGRSIADLNNELQLSGNDRVHLDLLKWSLLVIAASYFFTGYWKLVNAGILWASPDNLRIMLHEETLLHLVEMPKSAALIIDHVWLARFSGAATLMLECGFIVAVLLRRSITVFIIGLGAMHLLIATAMGIFFFDQYILYAFFIPWDSLARKFTKERLTVLYDSGCRFCALALLNFKRLDIKGQIRFVGPESASERLLKDGRIDPTQSMYLFKDDSDDPYEGYYAFRELFGRFLLLKPLSLIMHIPFVCMIGVSTYQKIASKRKSLFACSVSGEGCS